MRYLVQHKKAKYINFLVISLCISVYIYLVFASVLRYEMGYIYPDQITLYIKGNPDEFLEPIPLLSLLEEIHIYLFINIMLFLILFSISFRTFFPDIYKVLFGSAGLFFILLESIGKLAVYYGFTAFSLFSSVSFFVYIFIFFFINSVNLYCFVRGKIR